MSAQPSEPGGHDLIRPDDQVIRVGDQEAVVVSLDELRVLRALREQATPEALAAAELAAEIAEDAPHRARYLEWVAAGRPGEVTQEEMERAFAGSAGL